MHRSVRACIEALLQPARAWGLVTTRAGAREAMLCSQSVAHQVCCISSTAAAEHVMMAISRWVLALECVRCSPIGYKRRAQS